MQSSKWLQRGRVEAEGEENEVWRSREAQNYRQDDDSTPSYRERGTGLLTTAYPGSPSCPFLLSGVEA